MIRIELWKIAYFKQFGTDPDEEIKEHPDEVNAWRLNWQAGYDAAEEWATRLVDDVDDLDPPENENDSESFG